MAKLKYRSGDGAVVELYDTEDYDAMAVKVVDGWRCRTINGVRECWGHFQVAITAPDTIFKRNIPYPFKFEKRPCVTITPNDGTGWTQTYFAPYDDGASADYCTIACKSYDHQYLPLDATFGVHVIEM